MTCLLRGLPTSERGRHKCARLKGRRGLQVIGRVFEIKIKRVDKKRSDLFLGGISAEFYMIFIQFNFVLHGKIRGEK